MAHDPSDIHDNPRDEKYLRKEETTIDMPDVSDIPGQEHIQVPKMKMFEDTTISSDDEEGKGIFEENAADPDSDVSPEERELLRRTEDSMSGIDDEDRHRLMLDSRDDDGDILNERVDVSGDDLDIPGAEADDENESLGEEDEENNSYSLGGDRKD